MAYVRGFLNSIAAMTFVLGVLAPLALQGVCAAVAIGLAQLAISAAAVAASILLRPKPKGIFNEGPRLEDRVVMNSSYGQPIPLNLGGVVRVSGGIIWAQDIREVKKKESTEAGKGGGGQSVTTVTYSYFGDFAASFGEGIAAADGLIKVWADGKLIVDHTAVGDAVYKYPDLQLRFYRGDDTQLPDSLIQTVEGVANAPAYRGQCYAVFENLPLADFGNRIPNLEGLVAYAANPTLTSDIVDEGIVPDGIEQVFYCYDRARHIFYWLTDESSGSEARLVRYNPVTNEIEAERTDWGGASQGLVGEPEVDDQGFVYVTTRHVSADDPGFRTLRLDPVTLATLYKSTVSTSVTSGFRPSYAAFVSKEENGGIGKFLIHLSVFGSSNNHLALTNLNANGDLSGIGDVSTQDALTFPNLELISQGDPVRGIVVDKNQDVWVVGVDTGDAIAFLYQLSIDMTTPAIGRFQLKRTINLTAIVGFSSIHELGYDAATHSLFVGRTLTTNPVTTIVRLDIKTMSVVWQLDDTDASVTNGELIQDSSNSSATQPNRALFKYAGQRGELVVIHVNSGGGGTKRVNRIPIATGKVSKTYSLTDYGFGTDAGNGESLYDGLTDHFYCLNSAGGLPEEIRRVSLDRVTTLTTTLQSVVETLCARGGLSPAQIDASALSALAVRGYPIANLPSTVRSLLEPLSLAYFFDGVETDFLIRFVLRSASLVAATIPDTELGAFSETSPPENLQRLEEEIGQDLELPEQIDVRFIDVDKDLQIGDQYEKRISSPAATTFSRKKITMDVPIVFSATEARAIVERVVYQEWVRKYGFKYQTLPKHLRLDPSDLVNITKEGLTFGLRLAEVTFGAGLVIEHNADAEDLETYAITGQVGDDALHQSTGFSAVGASELFLIDYLLQDSDDPAAGLALPLYLGAAPQAETTFWRGATLQRSIDGGATFTQLDVARDDSTWGRLMVTVAEAGPGAAPEFAMAPFFDWMVWDRTTVFRAIIVSGSARLTSVSEAALLADVTLNALLVGQEIIRFATVVDNGDGSFDFSILLRGRRGTGWAAEAGHHGGATVLLLREEALSYNAQAPSERDVVRHWRATTLAGILDNSAVRAQALTGLGLKPKRVSHVESVRDGSNNLTLTWIRETRTGEELNWEDGVTDNPLGEATESYQLDYVAPNHRGASTGITLTTLTQTGAGWTVDAFAGFYVIHRYDPQHGATDTTRGYVHLRRIVSNTATVLTLADRAWAFTPTVGDSYFIVNTDAPTLERTEIVSTQTASYTAAEQTADGVTLGNGILAIITQLSAAVAKGVARYEPMFGT